MLIFKRKLIQDPVLCSGKHGMKPLFYRSKCHHSQELYFDPNKFQEYFNCQKHLEKHINYNTEGRQSLLGEQLFFSLTLMLIFYSCFTDHSIYEYKYT